MDFFFGGGGYFVVASLLVVDGGVAWAHPQNKKMFKFYLMWHVYIIEKCYKLISLLGYGQMLPARVSLSLRWPFSVFFWKSAPCAARVWVANRLSDSGCSLETPIQNRKQLLVIKQTHLTDLWGSLWSVPEQQRQGRQQLSTNQLHNC